MASIAEIISIGDELASGERLDTNSQWLSQRLGELGVAVRYHTTVADDLAANVEVFRLALGRADIVVATGGLGPTADDLTRDAIAAAIGAELYLDQPSLDHIRGLVRPAQSGNARAERLAGHIPGWQPADFQSRRYGTGNSAGARAAGASGVPAVCLARGAGGNAGDVFRHGRPGSGGRAGSSRGRSAIGGSNVSAPAKASSRRCCPI